MQVADDTQILVQDQPSTIAEIRKGDRLRAAHEVCRGRKLARSNEVTERKAGQQRSSRAAGDPPTQ